MEKRPQHDPEPFKKNEDMPLKKALNKRDWPGSAWGPGELENSALGRPGEAQESFQQNDSVRERRRVEHPRFRVLSKYIRI